MASNAGSPCGACKFLRRKCTADCIFAPHFCSENSSAGFAGIHRIFGASNASKLLQNVTAGERGHAAATIAYEAHARLGDPVYGCVAQIFVLQHQVSVLQAQVIHARAQLTRGFGNFQYASNMNNNTIRPDFDANRALIYGFNSNERFDQVFAKFF